MDYLLIAVIVFLASYVGASLGSYKKVENPIAPVIDKISERKIKEEVKNAIHAQAYNDKAWMFGQESEE